MKSDGGDKARRRKAAGRDQHPRKSQAINSAERQLELGDGTQLSSTDPAIANNAQALGPDTTSSGSPSRPPDVHVRLSPAKPTPVYNTYWRFAHERQEIFFRRFEGGRTPWTHDPILQQFKFTNTYRASDRVSQYLIRNVIYSGNQSPSEVFFRVLLFKTFNRIDTWERFVSAFGEVRYDSYRFSDYDRVLSEALEGGRPIYSAAYIMPTGGRGRAGLRKHQMHLRLIERMMADRIADRISESRTMHRAFELLRGYPTIGDFLAYQYVTDLNYSAITDFSESEFVVPGPGARDGIRKCFQSLGGLNESEIIRVVAERQEEEFGRLGLKFRSLWGRPLQYIDCQNLFCEVDKYARVRHPEFSGRTGRTRIKQRFNPTQEGLPYWYPPKWGLNRCVTKSSGPHQPKSSLLTRPESLEEPCLF